MMVHLDTTGAGMREAVADYAVEIAQSEAGRLDELSEAMAREAGDDCAVEIALASADQLDWASVAASLDLAEDGLLVVFSAWQVQVLVGAVARHSGPVQVELGEAVHVSRIVLGG
jgi:hypothetical protein